jgi:hypothetical protein
MLGAEESAELLPCVLDVGVHQSTGPRGVTFLDRLEDSLMLLIVLFDRVGVIHEVRGREKLTPRLPDRLFEAPAPSGPPDRGVECGVREPKLGTVRGFSLLPDRRLQSVQIILSPALGGKGRGMGFKRDPHSREVVELVFLLEHVTSPLRERLTQGGDESAPCLAPAGRYVAGFLEVLEGLPKAHAGDAEGFGQLPLRRQPVARPQLATPDEALDVFSDALGNRDSGDFVRHRSNLKAKIMPLASSTAMSPHASQSPDVYPVYGTYLAATTPAFHEVVEPNSGTLLSSIML